MIDVPAGPSIRAQAKKQKYGAGGGAPGAGQNKEVVKAVLANPLTVPWPNLPRHLQTTVLQTLPSLVPDSIASYHTARGRCHRTEKRKDRSKQRAEAIRATHIAQEQAEVVKRDDTGAGADKDAKAGAGVVPVTDSKEAQAKKRPNSPTGGNPPKRLKPNPKPHPPNDQTPNIRPDPPEPLSHLVLGINEVIKSLERQTDALRMQLMMMGDALADQQKGGKRVVMQGRSGGKGRTEDRILLPTAPAHVSDDEVDEEDEAMQEGDQEGGIQTNQSRGSMGSGRVAMRLKGPLEEPLDRLEERVNSNNASDEPSSPADASPLEWIVIPIQSISPQSLISPIPAYCATFNTLVYQYNHLSKIVRTRIPADRVDELLGRGREEVRVVPMGDIEPELARMVGLRRLACLGIRASHPQLDMLKTLLPKSILHPPRHSLTLPFPTSSLTIHSKPSTAYPKSLSSNGGIPNDDAVPKAASQENKRPGGDSKNAVRNGKRSATASKRMDATTLLQVIHYAPVHVKGITTTIPADGNARKQKRLEEVRRKRRDAKERRKMGRKG